MDKDRHLIDCVSYILLDDPRFIDQRGGLSTFEPIYPSLAQVILAPWDHSSGQLPYEIQLGQFVVPPISVLALRVTGN